MLTDMDKKLSFYALVAMAVSLVLMAATTVWYFARV